MEPFTMIEKFRDNQTLSGLELIKNAGIGLKVLENNKWVALREYTLPFRFVILYDNNFLPTDLGVY